jgi:hypothetical protein
MLTHSSATHSLGQSKTSYPAKDVEKWPESKYFYLFLLFVFVMPLWPNYAVLNFGGLPNLAPDRLLRASLFFGLIFISFSKSQAVKILKARISENWVMTVMLFAYYGIRIVSAFFSSDAIIQLNIFFRTDFLVSLPVYFFALLAIKDKNSVRKVFIALTLSSAISSLLALFEFSQQKNIFASLIPVTSDYTLGLFIDKTRDSVYRAQGTFEHPILLGQFFMLMLPVIWGLFKASHKLTHSIFYASCGALALAAIYVSGSRAAQGLSLLIIIAIGFWEIYAWTKSSRNRVLQYLVISQMPIPIFSALAAIYAYKESALGSTRETMSSTNARFDMLTGGFPKIFEAPIGGHGLGETMSVFSFAGRAGMRTLDNYYLLIALESGFLAPVLLMIVLFLAAPPFKQLFALATPHVARQLVACFLAMVTYFFQMSIHSLSQQMWLILVLAGCSVVLIEKSENGNSLGRNW